MSRLGMNRRITGLLTSVILTVLPVPISYAQQVTEQRGVANNAMAATTAANAELDGMTRELAVLLAEPGFRGYLRSEIAKSKNRESILELDKFLERAAKRPGGPPGLSKLHKSAKGVAGRIKSSGLNDLEGLDLYIPVEAHRAKWKGGADLLVAFAPMGDEEEVREIIAYDVKAGRRIMLDPNRPPDTPVLALVAEEHESHQFSGHQRVERRGELPGPELPKPDVVGENPEERPVPQSEGNSYVGLYSMLIRDMKEHWLRGLPEIKAFFGIGKGNACLTSTLWYKGTVLETLSRVMGEGSWYATWPNITEVCTPTFACWYFDNSYLPEMVLRIYEHDGGSQRTISSTLNSNGAKCTWLKHYSSDDNINGTRMYTTNFAFGDIHKHDLGNAYVKWRKQH